MRLKYHLELPNEGLMILEAEPQMRNLVRYCSSQFSSRYPLPFVQFTIRYIKIKDKFHYPGVYGSGLRITGSLKSLSSIQDNVFFLPTGDAYGGYVCTPHNLDMKGFDNLNELVNSIITLWYGCAHSIGCQNWHTVNLENLSNLPWTKNILTYKKAIEVGADSWGRVFNDYKNYPLNYKNPAVPSFNTKLPTNAIIADELWGQHIKINLLPEEKEKEIEIEIEKEIKQINLQGVSRKIRKKLMYYEKIKMYKGYR